jgi:rare lipoprotein A
MLINQKEVKKLALSCGARKYHKLTRVSKKFLERMDVNVRLMIESAVESLPSVGKTIMVLAMFLMVSNVAQAATASWYDSNSVKKEGTCKSELCYTASGKEIHALEKRGVMFAASNTIKLGKKARVCSRRTGACVEVVILDRGGFGKYGRSIDLCHRAFEAISSTRRGLEQVTIEVIK